MGFPGSRATPTVDGDFIYTFSGKGDLTCLKIADGAKVWQTSIIKEVSAKDLTWGTSASPAVIGDVIYVQAGMDGPMVVAIDKKTGKLLWKSASGVASYATPILIKVENTDQLIVAAGKEILALNPADGKTIWSIPWVTSYDVNAATPIFQKNQLFVSSGYGHGSILLSLTATAAKTVWEKKNSIQAKFPTPFLDPDDTLIGNSEGTITALDWSTGNTLWKGKDNLGPGGSLLRLAENKLLAISERGKLFLYKADRKEITRIATFTAVDGTQVWASPVVSNGRLFLKGAEELAAFDVAPK
jgi:outer membrane protein assembly factor BamB